MRMLDENVCLSLMSGNPGKKSAKVRQNLVTRDPGIGWWCDQRSLPVHVVTDDCLRDRIGSRTPTLSRSRV